MGHLFIDNNTTEDLQLEISGGPDRIFKKLTDRVKRETCVPVIWFSRWNGVYTGEVHNFAIRFRTAGKECAIDLSLRGYATTTTLHTQTRIGGQAEAWTDGWYVLKEGDRLVSLGWSPSPSDSLWFHEPYLRIGELVSGTSRLEIFGSPTKVLFFDGDHTWVAAQPGFCDRVLGPGDHYCAASRWKNGVYTPPEGRLIGAGPADLAKASAFAAEGGRCFTQMSPMPRDIPAQAWVSYLVNGVCHQITNRILTATDLSVWDEAKGALWSYGAFGKFGTLVPASFLAPLLPTTVLAVVQLFCIKDLADMWARHRGPSTAGISGLADSAAAGEGASIDRRILELHLGEAETLSTAPETEAQAMELLAGAQRRHRVEMELVFGYALREGVEEAKRTQVVDVLTEMHAADRELAREMVRVTRTRPFDGSSLATAAAEDTVQPASMAEVTTFVAAVNRACSAPARDVAGALGAAEFERVFGFAADQGCALAEPAPLLAAGR